MKVPDKSAELLETVVNELPLAIGQLLRRLRTDSNPSELNLAELAVLARLEQSGPMTTAQLARAESMKPQSMGTILSNLEKDGLLRRQPHPTDGRQVLVLLSEEGLNVRRKRTALKRQWFAEAIAKLNADEQTTLIAAASLIKRLAGT